MNNLVTCLICLACSTVATGLFAQGQINWNNNSSTLISVYNNGSSGPIPVRVSPETTYHFGLFVAPPGTPAPTSVHDPNWQLAVAYATNSATTAGRMQNPGIATVIGFEAGTSVNFVVRAWQSLSGGADWPAANQTLIISGQSAVGTAILGGQSYPVPSAFAGPGSIGGFSFGCLGCDAPDFILNPSNQVVRLGDSVTLTTSVASHPFFSVGYQWRKQLVSIAGANKSSLTLTNVTLADAGKYDVIASHFSSGPPPTVHYGSAASAVATVTVIVPPQLSSPVITATNRFEFTVTGAPGTNYVVQVSTNLTTANWVSTLTNASPFTFVDSNAQDFPQKYYRALAR